MSVQAGYSGTPLPRKLGIKPGSRIALDDAPPGFEHVLGELPDGVRVLALVRAPLDLVVCFVDARARLERRFDGLRDALVPDGALWVAWPKKASGVNTDLTENVVREIALARGLVDTKVCAIDDTWSGPRLVRRLRDR